jgi:GntR family transcriptional regulator, transcriptional repressor for pyruvate dehydrogenase complex
MSAIPNLPEPATFAPVSRASVVDAVVARLRADIVAGRLEAGSKLPAERELAAAFGVNRLTLRAALAQLEAIGFVQTKHGMGTVVLPWRERVGLEHLGTLARSISPSEGPWEEVVRSMLELRRMLAAEGLALAAERCEASHLEEVRAVMASQAEKLEDPIAFARGEVAFQRVLARASKNVALELVLNNLARFFEEVPGLTKLLYDRCDDSMQVYPMILAILENRAASDARSLVPAFLAASDEAWLARHRHTLNGTAPSNLQERP